MKLILPTPPSNNALYANAAKGRRKTPEYKAWIKAAGWQLQIQARGQAFDVPVVIALALSEDSGLDVDNCSKAPVDLLVRHKVIPDDKKKYVRGCSQIWQTEDDKIHVTVEPAAI